MKTRDMLIFFLIVFTLYFSANYYIFIKGYRALDGYFGPALYTILFILIAFTFIAGKILERNSSSLLADILNVIGGFWLAFMLYAFLLLLLADMLFLTGKIAGLINSENGGLIRLYSYLGTITVSALIIFSGFINAVNPVSKKYSLEINPTKDKATTRVFAVSDIHLGSVVRKRSLKKLSGMIREANPDILLFLGDLLDGEINPVLRDDLLATLELPENLKDVYAITGNHEFIGGYGKTVDYIENNGIRILKDEVVKLESGIQLVGRIDRDSFRYTGKRRLELDTLLESTDPSLPVIIMDHQPRGRNEEIEGEFDLMLSGHTHKGQMWPFSYIVKSIFKDSYGISSDGGRRHYIVSSGFGTWGPRVRIGSRSEVLIIDLISKGSN